MNLLLNLSLLLLLRVYVYTTCAAADDKPYEIIKFGIPHTIWKQALRPTPVLKSPATIVVPVYVPSDNEEENELEDAGEQVTENVEVDATLVNEDVPEVIQNPVAAVVNATEPLQGEVLPPQQNVPGQLIRFPCSCAEGQCGCCTGAILERFRMKTCGNMTFVPEDFIFDVKLTVNNNTVIRRRVSASDPPPICFNPRRAPFVEVCVEISNIQLRNQNAHACLEINANIGGFPVYSAPFRCFSFGSSGIKQGSKPKPLSSSGPKPVNLFGNGEEEGGLIQNAAQTVLGGGDGLFGGGQEGLLGGEGGLFGGGGEGGLFGGGSSEGGLFGGGNSEGGLFGGGDSEGGLFGGGGGDDDGGLFGGGGSDDDGPFDGIGDAIGDFLDGRSLN